MRFLQTPNLPKTDVCLLAVSAEYPDILRKLQELGIDVLPIEPNKALSVSVHSHADLLCHPLGGNRIVVAKGENSLIFRFQRYGFYVTESASAIEGAYPNDAALDAARIGDGLIANRDILDQRILNHCIMENIRIITVRQGYAKCSVAVVDEHSLITSDRGIARAAVKAGMEVLEIIPGYIQLTGYSYGFIGGACGLISPERMAFVGNPKQHPDYNKIKKFLDHRKIGVEILAEGPLRDIGGLIPLMEKDKRLLTNPN